MNDAGMIPKPCARCGSRIFSKPEEDRVSAFCGKCQVEDFDFKLSRIISQLESLEISQRLDRDRISMVEDTVWALRQRLDPV